MTCNRTRTAAHLGAIITGAVLAVAMPAAAQTETQTQTMATAEIGRNLGWNGTVGSVAVARRNERFTWQLRVAAGNADESRLPDWFASVDLGFGRDVKHGRLRTRWLVGPTVVESRWPGYEGLRSGAGVMASYAVELSVLQWFRIGTAATVSLNSARGWGSIGLTAGLGP
jgi:hypothetical protein